MSDYWFKPKRFGYGATPTNWKGWASTFAFVLVLVSLFFVVTGARNGAVSAGVLTIWVVLVAIATLVFLRIARARTDGAWRWRWGERE
jgi:hypothetical protein